MTKYVQMDIRTLQAVKMGSTGSQSDHERALDYLAGSSLRGAFIGAYLKQRPNLELHKHPVERIRWLEGGIRFLNGYPADGERRSYPFPSCFYADKGAMKLFRQRGSIDAPVNVLDDRSGTAGKVRMEGNFMVGEKNGVWRWLETEMQGNLHINLRVERTSLYRYEAIAPGQTFAAVIALDEADEELLNFFRSFAGRKLHLGGSRSNGYGLCRVTDVRVMPQNPESPELDANWSEHLYLYSLSDVIIRDEWGRLSSFVPESRLEEWLGVKASLEEASVETITATGFNQKWSARLPQLEAIRKGSVFKYRLHGRPDPEKLIRLQNAGIGERLADGYGRILLLPKLHAERFVLLERSERIGVEVGQGKTIAIDKRRDMLQDIYKRIMLYRIRVQTEYYLLHLTRLTDDRTISSALLATWMEVLGQASDLSPEQGKREIFDFVENLQFRNRKQASGEMEKQERLNQKALNALRNARIAGDRWLDFMKQAVEEADDIEALSRRLDLKWLELPGLDRSSVFGREETYRLTLSMLREFIRLRRLTRAHERKEERRA